MNTQNDTPTPTNLSLLGVRAGIGGILMGLANLVPGISGGTMLLAAGVYPAFINGIAEVTTLKFRLRSIIVLAGVVSAAGLAILLLAGVVKELVIDHRWVMYSIFIGLTLGGAPIVWRMIGKPSRAVWFGAAGGFACMALLAISQQSQWGAGSGGGSNVVMLLLAGVAGASAMILPGVSGGYLLLVLGQYVPILSGIDALKEALKAGDMAAAMGVGLDVVLPVGIGVVVGVVGVSNLLRLLLNRCRAATLGVLLGLLLGAVVGLWPFQESVVPSPGDVVKGQTMTTELIAELDLEDYPTDFFKPSGAHVGGALGLILIGLAVTLGIARFGGEEEP